MIKTDPYEDTVLKGGEEPRSEMPTVNDLPVALRAPMNQRAQALGRALYELLQEGDELLGGDDLLQEVASSDGLKQFIDTHPGVRVGMGTGPFLVALMPDGTVMAVDQDGTVFSEDNPAIRTFDPSDFDWDAISDAIGPDE